MFRVYLVCCEIDALSMYLGGNTLLDKKRYKIYTALTKIFFYVHENILLIDVMLSNAAQYIFLLCYRANSTRKGPFARSEEGKITQELNCDSMRFVMLNVYTIFVRESRQRCIDTIIYVIEIVGVASTSLTLTVSRFDTIFDFPSSVIFKPDSSSILTASRAIFTAPSTMIVRASSKAPACCVFNIPLATSGAQGYRPMLRRYCLHPKARPSDM